MLPILVIVVVLASADLVYTSLIARFLSGSGTALAINFCSLDTLYEKMFSRCSFDSWLLRLSLVISAISANVYSFLTGINSAEIIAKKFLVVFDSK